MAQLEDALRLRGPEIVIYGAGNVAPLLNGHSHNVLRKQLAVHREGRCPSGQMPLLLFVFGSIILYKSCSVSDQPFSLTPSSSVHAWSRWTESECVLDMGFAIGIGCPLCVRTESGC